VKYIVLIMLLIAFVARADDCHYSKVTAIQSQSGNVLIQLENASGSYWKNLGKHSDEYTKSYQSIAQHALATEYTVMLRFPSGHECSATDYGAVLAAFRILK